jgi:hypothetical protein
MFPSGRPHYDWHFIDWHGWFSSDLIQAPLLQLGESKGVRFRCCRLTGGVNQTW